MLIPKGHYLVGVDYSDFADLKLLIASRITEATLRLTFLQLRSRFHSNSLNLAGSRGERFVGGCSNHSGSKVDLYALPHLDQHQDHFENQHER